MKIVLLIITGLTGTGNPILTTEYMPADNQLVRVFAMQLCKERANDLYRLHTKHMYTDMHYKCVVTDQYNHEL